MATSTLMPGFEPFDVTTEEGITIHGARAGKGAPVLLLHGHPQTHVTWCEVAPRLVAAGYEVVATDPSSAMIVAVASRIGWPSTIRMR